MPIEPNTNEKRVVSTSDLAAKLGISRWAVSRALNGKPGISKVTAARVRQAVREHHFQPDPLGRGLRGGSTGAVGVCLPRHLLTSGFSEHDTIHPAALAPALNALFTRLESSGFSTLMVTSGSASHEAESLQRVAALRVDAAILVCPRMSDLGRGLGPLRFPCVAIDPEVDLPSLAVRYDRIQAAALTFEHLLVLGHQRFALLGFSHRSSALQSYEKAANQLTLSWRHQIRTFDLSDLSSVPLNSVGYGWALAGVILRRNLKVTALVAADDAIASGVIARLRHEGKKVPDDFSVIGHGNLMFGDIFDPPVSTIDPQTNRLFEEAADAVSTLLRAEGRVETREILVNPLLLKRASTAAARAVS